MLKQLPSPQNLLVKESTMYITADQIAAANQNNLEVAKGLATKSFAGFAHTQALLAAKDPQQVLALQTGLVAPMAEKAVAYSRHVYGIAVEAGAEFTKAFEGKAAEGQKAFGQVMDNMTKNAPAGTESAVAVLKSALASSQNAIESAQNAAKQALAMAESNVTAVTEQALSAAAAVAKKV